MKIRRKASAGTMQSSDLTVVVEPAERLTIEIESTVKKQFEELIRERIQSVLDRLGVASGSIKVSDRGALDYAIEARVEAALRRAGEE
ncbi:MAG: citrate lyase acyl carrier protein [Candidatus Eisenbacteria bacterium]|nr:citrate lyase acyl carrier protein [Candidatus Eisenbacteria bacterium]